MWGVGVAGRRRGEVEERVRRKWWWIQRQRRNRRALVQRRRRDPRSRSMGSVGGMGGREGRFVRRAARPRFRTSIIRSVCEAAWLG